MMHAALVAHLENVASTVIRTPEFIARREGTVSGQSDRISRDVIIAITPQHLTHNGA